MPIYADQEILKKYKPEQTVTLLRKIRVEIANRSARKPNCRTPVTVGARNSAG